MSKSVTTTVTNNTSEGVTAQSTLGKVWSNTKNFLRNTLAGTVLATTVSATDAIENTSTTITRPTANILQTIENTSDALGRTLQHSPQGNILHTAVNVASSPLRALATIGEGVVKGVGHSLQYVSGAAQTAANQYKVTADQIHQTFSTSPNSPDIPHNDIHLKDPTPLGRDGSHMLAGKNHTPAKSKVGRRLGNIKNSIINAPMNILRTGTDIVAAGTQRVRGVIESVEGVAKDVKKSRSGVFTKGQSFGKKLGNIFSKGIWGSVKSIGKGIGNIVNEGVLKTGVAAVGVATNLVGRTLGNTIVPLVSSKADHPDNLFEKNGAFNKMTEYYKSTPRGKNVEAGTTDTGGDEKTGDIPQVLTSTEPEAKEIEDAAAPTISTPVGTAKKDEETTHPDTMKGESDDASPTTGAKAVDENNVANGRADPFTARAFPPKQASHETPKAVADHPPATTKGAHPEAKKDHPPEATTEKKDEPHQPNDKGNDSPNAHRDDEDTGKGKPQAKEDNAHEPKDKKAGNPKVKNNSDETHPEKNHTEHEAKAESAPQ